MSDTRTSETTREITSTESTTPPVWEQRWHPLRQEWVIVAAHRQNRPWNGAQVRSSESRPPRYEPDCHLCPGNERVHGERNPDYGGVFVFDNDHPCVGGEAPEPAETEHEIFASRRAEGVARVVCYSPHHDGSLGALDDDAVDRVVEVWQEQQRELGARPEIEHVLIFENRGKEVGVSNPHPHGQIYATNFVFRTTQTEVEVARRHQDEKGRILLQDIVTAEMDDGRRVVTERDSAIAFVPYFARFAYELYVVPRETHADFTTLSAHERSDLACTLRDVCANLDALWGVPFPYVLTLHQAPTDGGDYGAYHSFVQIQPVLRKPGLLKYQGGPELGGGNFLSDTSPELKAAELRDAGASDESNGQA